jgi:hypothetical protein
VDEWQSEAVRKSEAVKQTGIYVRQGEERAMSQVAVDFSE